MKSVLLGLVTLAIFSCLSIAAPKGGTYSGEIMDSACAKAGSHDATEKQLGLTNAKDCTQACVKEGNKYVLYNKSSKKVYQLDDQTKPAQFAGEKVSVKGTLDQSSNTIHVADIQAAKGATTGKPSSY
jgi:hypothetical protein